MFESQLVSVLNEPLRFKCISYHKRVARYQMSLHSLTVAISLLFLEKLPCQVLHRRGVKSPFQLRPKFLYQIKGEALIL